MIIIFNNNSTDHVPLQQNRRMSTWAKMATDCYRHNTRPTAASACFRRLQNASKCFNISEHAWKCFGTPRHNENGGVVWVSVGAKRWCSEWALISQVSLTSLKQATTSSQVSRSRDECVMAASGNSSLYLLSFDLALYSSVRHWTRIIWSLVIAPGIASKCWMEG